MLNFDFFAEGGGGGKKIDKIVKFCMFNKCFVSKQMFYAILMKYQYLHQ